MSQRTSRSKVKDKSFVALEKLRTLIEHSGVWPENPVFKSSDEIEGAEDFTINRETFNRLIGSTEMIGDGAIDAYMSMKAKEIGTFTYASPQRITKLIQNGTWVTRGKGYESCDARRIQSTTAKNITAFKLLATSKAKGMVMIVHQPGHWYTVVINRTNKQRNLWDFVVIDSLGKRQSQSPVSCVAI